MGVKFDFHYWMKKYEDDYSKDTGGKYPVFVDEKGVEHEEKSPYFDTMSAMLQKRGYLLKKEFVSIGEWKTERQRKRYGNNTDQKVERTTTKVLSAPHKDKIRILVRVNGALEPLGISSLGFIPKRVQVRSQNVFNLTQFSSINAFSRVQILHSPLFA